MTEQTTDRYWSCQCKTRNIRPALFTYCPVCGADQYDLIDCGDGLEKIKGDDPLIADVEAQLREELQELTGVKPIANTLEKVSASNGISA